MELEKLVIQNTEDENKNNTVEMTERVCKETQDKNLFNLNKSYLAIKSKINLFIGNNLTPLFSALKNSGYGKLLLIIMGLFSIAFGYVTMALLQSLYFISCSVNSVRALKNNQDLKTVVNNWITYSAVVLIFYFLDLLSYMTGNVIKIVFETCKFMLLFCLYGSTTISENLNYGISRIYSCNNKVIDTTENGINTLLGYIYQSFTNGNIDEVIQSISNLTSKNKTN